MHIFHKYRYYGFAMVSKWLGGVVGGIRYEALEQIKKCEKCGKVKII